PAAPAHAPAAATPAAPPAPPPAGGILLKGPAARLAQNMDASLAVPTATTFRELAVARLERERKALNAALAAAGRSEKLSFTHLIAWAIVQATRQHPVMGATYLAKDGQAFRVEPDGVSLGLAVDVTRKDGSRGLLVPVVKRADRLTFAQFHAAYEALVQKARTGALAPDDLQGATMSLTNPGGLGTVASVPRLMVGQGSILAVGAIRYPAEFSEMPAAQAEALGLSKVMAITSTYDHRVIQGAESGAFLATVDALLQGEHGFYAACAASLGVAVAGAAAAAAAAPARAAAGAAPTLAGEEALAHVAAAMSLVKAFRTHGHLAARLDPLGSDPIGDPALDPGPLGLTPEVMAQIPSKVLRVNVPGPTLLEAFPQLQATYCGTIAYEVEHISSHEQRVWLRERIESGTFRAPLPPEARVRLLGRLTKVEALEQFLHKAYLGQKRFSIEGLDVMVPMLDQVIGLAADQGARDVVIGMAHRGRLNVLAHIIGRPYETIFAEFEGGRHVEAGKLTPEGGTGDVKYHHGAEGAFPVPSGKAMTVALVPNPSHLEFVGAVVDGRARAKQTQRRGRVPLHDPTLAVPVIIHGDAAFAGQGVVAETLNLGGLQGYGTGGTVHLIANNQVGFTTDPNDARSTRYASDLAKGFDVPIIHVNADDVEACMQAVRLAMAYREKFANDVVIDLVGYRRHGHNEGDEPTYTQPAMYARIKAHPTVRKLYAEKLVTAGVVTLDDVEKRYLEVYQGMVSVQQALRSSHGHAGPGAKAPVTQGAPVETAVPPELLEALNEQLLRRPEGFTVNPKLAKQLDRRRTALGPEGGIDWAHAEGLAYASLLAEGVPVRLTGQDVERGTFSQRHLVLHDAQSGARCAPLQLLPGALAPLELHNSPLSELATLGFEYGYSAAAPESLVVWEAQFGDFINGAQVIVDQFIVSGLSKWGLTTRLVLLLPHGYEGQGPEHSSARLERFLQLAAEGNIRVANPTTPAQYFHLLRRQAKRTRQRPLIVMTPKSLLRHPQATSHLAELTSGTWQPVLDDAVTSRRPADVTRVVLSSGKLHYELAAAAEKLGDARPALVRLEQLYSFPTEELQPLLARYAGMEELVWAQEEPRNMGAWAFVEPRLRELLPAGVSLRYVGRPERASPAEGYPAAHAAEQARIVGEALDVPVTATAG
ncbi:MAG: multifunctional oxoglutarate decarboxylase/oxoglutarate dehydrogenase thiamine pyrophosphate-binding subunit/dihydrolipoyllysine-residue succinyltransferase subunit, partial [Gemmatimonadales bacterium]|nr:multifunctional oxoglutarate decarboxylase/oxoglutarate dehydrogenase thiamine pyrophosphate-binding subunit/dihydrolipoyllysine-residue succinyltransferase subunit [Gemmatimonadales bacterium]